MSSPTHRAAGGAGATAGTQTLSRAVRLLKLLTAHNRLGLRLVDVYRRTDLERATVHRMLQGLVAEGLARQDADSKRYYLGPLLYEMGLAAAPRHALRDICLPYLQAIAEQTGDTVFMTVRSGFDGVCVARADGAFPIKAFVLDVGRHRPLNVGASGIAIMSEMSDEEITRILRVNLERTQRKNPRYHETVLRAAIAATRELGYSTNRVMESPPVSSVGMSIRYPDGSPAAALSVSTLASRLTKARLPAVVTSLRDAISLIEEELKRLELRAAAQTPIEDDPA